MDAAREFVVHNDHKVKLNVKKLKQIDAVSNRSRYCETTNNFAVINTLESKPLTISRVTVSKHRRGDHEACLKCLACPKCVSEPTEKDLDIKERLTTLLKDECNLQNAYNVFLQSKGVPQINFDRLQKTGKSVELKLCIACLVAALRNVP